MAGLALDPIDALRRREASARVALGGRVVHTEPGALLVQDVTGAVRVEGAGDVALGSWVALEGTWTGDRVVANRVLAVERGGASFARAGSEWSRLTSDGARRARLLQARAKIFESIRGFFRDRAFLEVDTPLMVPSPGLDLHLDAFEVAGAGAPRFLITSPEYQMKRLLAGGLPRIFQLCRCFRRAEQGTRHEPEFTMLEWYRTFAGAGDVMRDTEELVAHVARAMHGSTRIPGGIDVAPPWERLTVAEAFRRHAGADVAAVLPDEERFFRILVEQVEPQLGRGRPVFLTAWPASMASLARLDPRDPSVAERFEAYAGGVELCNGFGELIDPVEQRARLEADQAERRALGKPVYPIDERFLAALEEGLPPSGGNALGADRLVMMILGVPDIADVLALPSARL